MKNIITIDYDSEREESIKIAKPEDQKGAEDNPEQYTDMVMDDISTLAKGLATVIAAADKDGVMEKSKAIEAAVNIIRGSDSVDK